MTKQEGRHRRRDSELQFLRGLVDGNRMLRGTAGLGGGVVAALGGPLAGLGEAVGLFGSEAAQQPWGLSDKELWRRSQGLPATQQNMALPPGTIIELPGWSGWRERRTFLVRWPLAALRALGWLCAGLRRVALALAALPFKLVWWPIGALLDWVRIEAWVADKPSRRQLLEMFP